MSFAGSGSDALSALRARTGGRSPGRAGTRLLPCLGLVLLLNVWIVSASPLQVPVTSGGIGYTNIRLSRIPLSIHVVQVSRTNSLYELHSVHADNTAVGLETLTEQIGMLNPALGQPIAGINGDFYQRDRSYAGAPRGLQVTDGELISGPGNRISFWTDANGEPHAASISSKFEVTWPDSTVSPFRLNGERSPNGVELYTPAIGRSTRAYGGRELTLERVEGSPWLPFRVCKTYSARIRQIRDSGDTKMSPDTLVLSLGPGPARRIQGVQTGAVVQISTATTPALHGVRTALGGGPLLIHNGKAQRLEEGMSERYEFSSMFEQHPRAAIGWNQDWFFLVEVDGRQRGLSIGITLDDLASFMVQLGCQEAMNCDGGGSATLWFLGDVRNSPCYRAEREIANSLVIVKKKTSAPSPSAASGP